jgi:hypothetical protein
VKDGKITGAWCAKRNGKLKRFPKECDFKINRINTKDCDLNIIRIERY